MQYRNRLNWLLLIWKRSGALGPSSSSPCHIEVTLEPWRNLYWLLPKACALGWAQRRGLTDKPKALSTDWSQESFPIPHEEDPKALKLLRHWQCLLPHLKGASHSFQQRTMAPNLEMMTSIPAVRSVWVIALFLYRLHTKDTHTQKNKAIKFQKNTSNMISIRVGVAPYWRDFWAKMFSWPKPRKENISLYSSARSKQNNIALNGLGSLTAQWLWNRPNYNPPETKLRRWLERKHHYKVKWNVGWP